jgi:hypothetical protein
MRETSVYIEDTYLVLKIPFSEIVENKELLNLLEILKAEQLKKKLNISNTEFEKLKEDFDTILRNKLRNWFEEARIKIE